MEPDFLKTCSIMGVATAISTISVYYIYIENTWLGGFTSSHVVLCVYLFVLPSGKLT